MPTDPHDHAAVETKLWTEIEKHQIGMLGVAGREPHHVQPMTAFVERAADRIWFFTYKDTDLARAAGEGVQAMFVFQSKGLYACVDGELSIHHDRERIDRYWNAIVAAWYPEGKDDPRLTLLRLDCAEAQVWLSEIGPLRFGWEIGKANVKKIQPDVGGRADLDLH